MSTLIEKPARARRRAATPPVAGVHRTTLADLDLIESLMVYEARESFWVYRRLMHPKMKIGWWQREVAAALQQFVRDLRAGMRPKLVIEAPPQHGKSQMVVDLLTWLAGIDPDKKVFYTSFSKRLGVRANLMCQRMYDHPRYQQIFPDTRIADSGADHEDASRAIRSHEMVEYVGREGYFRNTTVRGSITGEGLDLGVIDDPIKGREEAGSLTIRDKTWDWLTDDFFSRFSEEAGLLCILTRWHVDDPIGRLRAQLGDDVKVLSYPAIAVRDEPHRKAGEALFPEHKSLDFLLERKLVMASANWEALYQQNPRILGGNIIKGSQFVRYTVAPIMRMRNIYADTAQKTEEQHDYSVLECWGLGVDGRAYLLDLIRGKWEAPELKRRTVAFWNKHKALEPTQHGQLRMMKVEDKASGTGLIQEIRTGGRIPIIGVPRSTDKYTRVLDVLGYIESGYVCVPEDAAFTNDFIAECEDFTADDSHSFDDQVDPMIDAINDLLAKNTVKQWENML